MKYEIHKTAAEEYLAVADEYYHKLSMEKDETKKTALRVVAAQNYFYCTVNVIEAIFAKKQNYHSYSHENRMNKILENQFLFTQEIVKLYDLVDRDLRNKVAYRGENGQKYKDIRALAKLLMGFM